MFRTPRHARVSEDASREGLTERRRPLPTECGQQHLMDYGPRLKYENRKNSAEPQHSPLSASRSKMQRGEEPGPPHLPLKALSGQSDGKRS